jgi:membrane protease YdiL (CAAX protease family)
VLAVVLLIIGVAIIYLTGNPETTLDRMLKTSRGAALATAFLATFTAPLVEEVVYRGVLFSGLRKHLGAVWAGLFVVVLFALVHVPQYIESPGTIAVILLLSAVLTVIRAYTGQLFYCFVIHLVFNGIQSVFIVADTYLKGLSPETPPVPAPDPALVLRLLGLFG